MIWMVSRLVDPSQFGADLFPSRRVECTSTEGSQKQQETEQLSREQVCRR